MKNASDWLGPSRESFWKAGRSSAAFHNSTIPALPEGALSCIVQLEALGRFRPGRSDMRLRRYCR